MLNTKTNTTIRLAAAAAILTAGLFTASAGQAGTLENLERERALVVAAMLDTDLTPAKRQAKIESAKPRLIDLERMVLRDNKLKGRNTPTVRKAFKNYDLTFMVHASLEKKISIFDNWMSQLGLTTQNIMSAKIGRR